MLALHSTKRFEKDYRLMIRRGYDIARLKEVVLTLRIPENSRRKIATTSLAEISRASGNAISRTTGF